jgi:hypothetical protein
LSFFRGHVVGRRFLQALAGIAVSGLHAELLRERRCLLVDGGMVGDHLLRELLHFLVLAPRLGELAGVDVDLVRGDDDAGDLRIGRRLRERGERKHQGKYGGWDLHRFSLH